jgi:two-component system chemotaxis response regulator CheY
MVRIMIADDSDAIRLVLRDILAIGNFDKIIEAVDGAEAVDYYSKNRPDILLLDLAMPKKDGYTVVKEIMQIDPNAKIILITASDDQKVINQCLEAGATTYISKPFDFNGVLKAINDILEK